MSDLLLFTLFALRFARALPLNSPLLPSYDYIVVGGGPAGLTVANRLSEDPTVTVLLLEAGPADQGELEVEVPALVGEDIGSRYDWNLSTVPQVYLDGAPRSIPQGHALGGGTIINGMLWNRGGQGDYNDWVTLGNPGWSWDAMLPYFMRSETYTPVYSEDIAEQFSIEEDPAVHGTSGPVSVSFPKYFWNSSAMLFSALNELGVPTAYDPNTGLIAGASFLPLDLDPNTEERSTARKAYYDPYVNRPNLWVSTGQIVTQILFAGRPVNAEATVITAQDNSIGQGSSPGMPGGIFGGTTTLYPSRPSGDALLVKRSLLSRLWSGLKRSVTLRQSSGGSSPQNLTAVGVQFATDAGSPRQNVSATREVIVAAGAIHSPQLLMLSGVGPAPALQDLGISVNMDLPGVGNNLQDHGQVWCWYPYHNSSYPNPTELSTNQTFADQAWDQYNANRTGPLTSISIDGVAFPALPWIVNGSTTIVDAAENQAADQYLAGGLDSTVIAGYTQQLPLLTNALRSDTRGAYELLNANDGVLTVSNMRPFSRGSVTLRSSQPFIPPLIDPRYASNPIDVQVLQAAIAFNTRLLGTPSLSQMDPQQVYPPANASDEEIILWINSKWQTEYHPAGTCSMMPLELGGVVSPELLVYGTNNLRVVDSSIMPMLPAAHLQAVVYGIAEKAADIIKGASSSDESIESSLDSSASTPMASSSTPSTSRVTPSSISSQSSFVPTSSSLTTPSTAMSSTITSSTSSQASSSGSSIVVSSSFVTSTLSFAQPNPTTTQPLNLGGGAAFTSFVTVVYTATVYV